MTDILLFAAGLGTRMGALTANRPKPLVTVAGTPLIDHALQLVDTPEIGTRVVNVHYLADQMRSHLDGKAVSISDETDLLRETGGGLRHALPLLQSDPVMTMNTDAVWSGPNPVSLLHAAWQDDMECLLLLVPRKNVHGHLGEGDFTMDADGHLTWAHGHIYTGVQMIRKSLLDDIPGDVFSMHDPWNIARDRGTFFGTLYPGQWCDVGQPESIPLAEAMLREENDV